MLSIQKQAFFPDRLRTLLRMAREDENYKERLDAAMKLAKADRKALALGMGVTVQAVGDALLGKTRAFSAANNMRAARVLGVDPNWLATGEGEPRPPLMKERAGLSAQAVAHALSFDQLTEPQKRLWNTLVATAQSQFQAAADGGQIPLTDLTTHPQTTVTESGTTKTPVQTDSEFLQSLTRLEKGVGGARSQADRSPEKRTGGGARRPPKAR